MIELMMWIFGIYLWAHYTVATWFFMVSRLSNMNYDKSWRGVVQLAKELGLVVAVPLLPSLVIGYVADVLFNATYGTVAFRELPKETTFTARVKRNSRLPDSDHKLKMGLIWKGRLNRIMPGHV